MVSANPPPQGFQVITPPDNIPTEIPPVNLNEPSDGVGPCPHPHGPRCSDKGFLQMTVAACHA